MRHLLRKVHNGPGQKPQTGSVRNPRETARYETIKATGRLPRSVNQRSPAPRDPKVSQSRPRSRPDSSPEPADIPLPRLISSPAQCCLVSFPCRGDPQRAHRRDSAPPHSPAAYAASSGAARAGRTRPAALRRSGRAARPGRGTLGQQEASTTGKGGAFWLSLGLGGGITVKEVGGRRTEVSERTFTG